MNSKIFNHVLQELNKIEKSQDLVKIQTFDGHFIIGILLEKKAYRTILRDGYETDDNPTIFTIRSLNNKNPEFDNKDIEVNILQIIKFEVEVV